MGNVKIDPVERKERRKLRKLARKRKAAKKLKHTANEKKLKRAIKNYKSNDVKKKGKKLYDYVAAKNACHSKKKLKTMPLADAMLLKLKSARFRYVSEHLYKVDSTEAQKFFKSDMELFKTYHEGYQQQVAQWPFNPLNIIIDDIRKLPENLEIGDFGCGEAQLALHVPQNVRSYDLIAINERVTAADIANLPVARQTFDIAVYCLSLMNTNVADILKEANRVLKNGGLLKICDVESRFGGKPEWFLDCLKAFGFRGIKVNTKYKVFYFFDAKKVDHIAPTKIVPAVTLYPCLYKRR